MAYENPADIQGIAENLRQAYDSHFVGYDRSQLAEETSSLLSFLQESFNPNHDILQFSDIFEDDLLYTVRALGKAVTILVNRSAKNEFENPFLRSAEQFNPEITIALLEFSGKLMEEYANAYQNDNLIHIWRHAGCHFGHAAMIASFFSESRSRSIDLKDKMKECYMKAITLASGETPGIIASSS